jgi:hypothetical protein
MRKAVSFDYPAPFIGTEADDAGVLSIKAAGWFANLLQSIPELIVDPNLCQEDWSVVIFTKRQKKPFHFYFWNGLAEEPRRSWIAEVSHGDLLGFHRFIPKSREGLDKLISDFHTALVRSPSVSRVTWFQNSTDAFAPAAKGDPTPD